MENILKIVIVIISCTSAAYGQELKFKWKFKGHNYQVTQSYNQQSVENCFYKINHWQSQYGATSPHKNKYLSYLRNYPCGEFIDHVAKSLKGIAEDKTFSRLEMANFLIAFVKSIPYVLDRDHQGVSHYPQTPYETLFLGKGDCEDHAILLAYLYSLFCYDILMMRTASATLAHLAVGLAEEEGIKNAIGLRSFVFKEKKYLYCEATPCSDAPCNSEVGECSTGMSRLKIEIIFDVPQLCDLYYE